MATLTAIGPYDIGDVARLTLAVTAAGVPADPTAVVLTVYQPDSTSVVYSGASVVKDAVGSYHCDVPVTQAGQVKFRWTGSGVNSTVEESSFLVRSLGPYPPFGPIAPSGGYEPAGSVALEAAARANADALLIPLTQKAVASGVATLDAAGLVPTTQMPPLAITDSFVVASQAAMLALTAQRGDVAIRTDLSQTFILAAEPATVLANWLQLATPVNNVLSVDGLTGTVVLPGDGAVGTATKRTLGAGALQAAAGADLAAETTNRTAADAAHAASASAHIGTYELVPTSGTLAARPASPVKGQTYLATDTAGGTLYECLDNSATWTQLAAGVTAAGGGAVASVDGLSGTVVLPSDGAAGTGTKRTLGTGATQATAGNDARLSDTRTPTDGTVTDAKVAGGAAIAESKLALASDAAAGTASRRTLGTGATQACAGNDARLSDTRAPTAGSVVDASVAAGAAIAKSKLAALAVVDADVAGGAAIAESKLALASDAAAGTASRRTLGTGALQATAGNDARLSDSRTPTAGSVVDASVGASAAIAKSKLAALAIVDADVSAISESKVTNLVSDLALKAPLASPTFTGTTTAPEFSASGLTGATAASRYVGATASAAPTTGTFAVGDFVIDQSGKLWICTVAGTPGTWVAPSGATGVLPGGGATGQTYTPEAVGYITGAGNSAGQTIGLAFAVPIWVPAITIDRISMQHWSAPTASEVMRLGLYSDNGRGYPNSLLVDGGTVDLSTAAAIKSVTVAQAVTASLVWIVGVRQGPTNTATLLIYGSAGQGGLRGMPSDISGANLYFRYAAWTQAGVTGALPATWTGTTLASFLITNGVPMLAVRAA